MKNIDKLFEEMNQFKFIDVYYMDGKVVHEDSRKEDGYSLNDVLEGVGYSLSSHAEALENGVSLPEKEGVYVVDICTNMNSEDDYTFVGYTVKEATEHIESWGILDLEYYEVDSNESVENREGIIIHFDLLQRSTTSHIVTK